MICAIRHNSTALPAPATKASSPMPRPHRTQTSTTSLPTCRPRPCCSFSTKSKDPHNLGAIIRSAHALGAQGVVVPAREAAGLSPAALKAAAGAAQHLPVCRVDNLQKALQKAAAGGLFIAGLDAQGEQPLTAADLAQPCALVIGSEGKGLRRMVQKRCDALLHIPMQRAAIGSLNASVAAGIALYEVLRQRQP